MVCKCKMCGGVLENAENKKIITCAYCGTGQTVPCPDNDRIGGLYERADAYRRNLEFDKALVLYEEILNENPRDPEAYWMVILCEYGIEYVEDSTKNKRVPTINRMQLTSVYENENYKAAIKYADEAQVAIYKAEAEEIHFIQKGILEISAKEEPFDIFICYKEGDGRGRRTMDSVLATDIYELLTEAGYKVFFSRVTLDDKFGQAYEPYIFAALQSAKAMIAVGTKPEHYNAVWVRNEWSRFLSQIKSGAKKVLIPAYKGMDPYELPEEFKHLQAINLGELGYQQDLLQGIRNIFKESSAKLNTEEELLPVEIGPILDRMYIALENKTYKNAESCANQILQENPEHLEAKVGLQMAIMGVFGNEDLSAWGVESPVADLLSEMKSGDSTFLKPFYKRLTEALPVKAEEEYTEAIKNFQNATTVKEYAAAKLVFDKLKTYKEAKQYAIRCRDKIVQAEEEERKRQYDENSKLAQSDNTDDVYKASVYFRSVPGYFDADKMVVECDERICMLDKQYRKKQAHNRKQIILWAAILVGSHIFLFILMIVMAELGIF